MKKQLISSGSEFEEKIGYSRAVKAGNLVFVSGTTGYDYTKMTISDDLLDQTEQCLKNISEALIKANSSLEDVVRVRYILAKADDFELCWPTLRKYFEKIRPAATMIEAKMSDPRMKIEIEVTAMAL